MNKISKLNIGLLLIISLLVFLLVKQDKSETLVNLTDEFAYDFTNFQFHNIKNSLDTLEVLQASGDLVDVKTELETNMVSIFVQYSLAGDISGTRTSSDSLITLCRLHLYNQNNNFEKSISDNFSVFINLFFAENEQSLDALYQQNKIDRESCIAPEPPIRLPNFRKLDAELEQLNR